MSFSSFSANWAGRETESLLWLASYPRSGNTFARILLANYFTDGADGYDINQLHDFIPPDTSKLLWTDFEHKNGIEAGRDPLWRSRPKFQDHYRRIEKHTPLPALKTHTANVEALGVKAFDIRKDDRIIYVVRHPLDVALSYSDFSSLDLEASIATLCEPGCAVSFEDSGIVEVRGSWPEHVASWLSRTSCPLLLVRYEELRGRSEQVLASMIDFLGAPVDAARLRKAVEASRFDKIRAQEQARSFIEAPVTRSGRFFRKGESFQWLRDFTPEQAYRLADACEPIMSKLGYTHPRYVFFDGRNALHPVDLRH